MIIYQIVELCESGKFLNEEQIFNFQLFREICSDDICNLIIEEF